jgi:hypothetical protein
LGLKKKLPMVMKRAVPHSKEEAASLEFKETAALRSREAV